jgi:hypothetical protein
MSDRKYRQRGYQDDDRDRRPPQGPSGPGQGRPEREPGAPAGARRISSEGAKNPKMMGYRAVARCARCGTIVDPHILSKSTCPKCHQDLRSCVQCASFDPGARFECTKPLSARVSPKDVANDCSHYEARTSWERETTAAVTSTSARGSQEPSGARKAFEDLFKL